MPHARGKVSGLAMRGSMASKGGPEPSAPALNCATMSGCFYGSPPLEFELRLKDGYSEAREWLHLPSTRDELDQMCQAARKRRQAA